MNRKKCVSGYTWQTLFFPWCSRRSCGYFCWKKVICPRWSGCVRMEGGFGRPGSVDCGGQVECSLRWPLVGSGEVARPCSCPVGHIQLLVCNATQLRGCNPCCQAGRVWLLISAASSTNVWSQREQSPSYTFWISYSYISKSSNSYTFKSSISYTWI